MANDQITESQIARALRQCDGLLTHTAQNLQMKVRDLKLRIEENVSLKLLCVELEERLCDDGERILIDSMRDDGNLKAALEILKAKGLTRGYRPVAATVQVNTGPQEKNLALYTDYELQQMALIEENARARATPQ